MTGDTTTAGTGGACPEWPAGTVTFTVPETTALLTAWFVADKFDLRAAREKLFAARDDY